MRITREQVGERLAALTAEYEQAIANANAINGAIQDCKHWLAVLAVEDAPEPETVREEASE